MHFNSYKFEYYSHYFVFFFAVETVGKHAANRDFRDTQASPSRRHPPTLPRKEFSREEDEQHAR